MDYTLENYRNEILKFVKSLTIKIDEIRKQQNFQIYIKNGLKEPNIEKSKYYLNLVSEYSELDNKIFVTINETTLELNKKNAITYKTIINNISKFDSFYDKLIIKNPFMTDFIKSFSYLNKYKLEDVIDAPNYTILNYKKDFLKDNEISFITDLQNFIETFMFKYHNPGYMLDELYLPVTLNNLYNGLFLYTYVYKLKYLLTSEVDEYNLVWFLNSYKNLGKYIDLFDKETSYWLYGKIRKLVKNIGNNSTLYDILVNVYKKNLYTINKTKVILDKPLLLEENIYDSRKDYVEKPYKLIEESAFKNNEVKIDEVKNIIYKNNLLYDYDKFDIEKLDLTIKEKLNKTDKTNIFKLEDPTKIKPYEKNKAIFLLNNITHILYNYDLNFEFDLTNPLTGDTIRLFIKDILYLGIYLLIKYFNIPVGKNLTIDMDYILNTNKLDKLALLSKTYYKTYLENIYDWLMGELVFVENIINYDQFKHYLIEVNKLQIKAWYLISNSNDEFLINDIRILFNEIFTQEKITFNFTEIEKYIKNKNLYSLIPEEVTDSYILKLLSNITGIELNTVNSLLSKNKRLIEFYNKVSSYKTDLVINLSIENDYINNHTTSNITPNIKPVVKIKDGFWERYEDLGYPLILDTKDLVKNEKIIPISNNTYIIADYNEIKTFFNSELRTVSYLYRDSYYLSQVDDLIKTIKPELIKDKIFNYKNPINSVNDVDEILSYKSKELLDVNFYKTNLNYPRELPTHKPNMENYFNYNSINNLNTGEPVVLNTKETDNSVVYNNEAVDEINLSSLNIEYLTPDETSKTSTTLIENEGLISNNSYETVNDDIDNNYIPYGVDDNGVIDIVEINLSNLKNLKKSK